jgi:hypothetical protein
VRRFVRGKPKSATRRNLNPKPFDNGFSQPTHTLSLSLTHTCTLSQHRQARAPQNPGNLSQKRIEAEVLAVEENTFYQMPLAIPPPPVPPSGDQGRGQGGGRKGLSSSCDTQVSSSSYDTHGSSGGRKGLSFVKDKDRYYLNIHVHMHMHILYMRNGGEKKAARV